MRHRDDYYRQSQRRISISMARQDEDRSNTRCRLAYAYRQRHPYRDKVIAVTT